MEQVDEALDAEDELALLAALQLPCMSLRGLRSDNGLWYLEQLAADRQQKALVTKETCLICPKIQLKCLHSDVNFMDFYCSFYF